MKKTIVCALALVILGAGVFIGKNIKDKNMKNTSSLAMNYVFTTEDGDPW